MKTSKFTEEQIVYALKQAELGTPVAEVCRKMGISDATFYNWRTKYGGLSPSELRRLKQLEEENAKLKRLVADLSPDKAMPAGRAVKKCMVRPGFARRALSIRRMSVCVNVSGLSRVERFWRSGHDEICAYRS